MPSWHKVHTRKGNYNFGMEKGVVCKVWNIQSATMTKGSAAQLKDSIKYILDNEKTDYELAMEQSAINDPLGQLGRECQYVENDIKTVSGAYVGSRNLVSTDIKGAVAEMMEVKKFYEKTDGRAALHGIISLSEAESDIKNASKLMQLCNDVMKEVFPDHQVIFAVHTNTDNLHIHFIINSVGLNGRKIHQDDKFMTMVLHPCINKYAKKYGFTPNAKWEKEYEEEKISFAERKIAMRKAIDLAIEQSNDFNDFVHNLRKNGVSVNIGEYISLKTDDMGKAIRTYKLGANYTKDAIVERIASRKREFVEVSVNDYTMQEKPAAVFTPVISKMGKYKDMNPEQKKYILSQIKLGRNPWREHQQMNWQLNHIADQLNQQERINAYVRFYSRNGTLQGAMDGIIEAKKKVMEEKKIIASQKRKYKPILDIYSEMKEIQKKAYLYEHEGVADYRPEFEQYRILTRRLRDGYNKDITEVAAFLQECDERTMYAHAQLQELSEEYREIKRYSAKREGNIEGIGPLADLIGLYDSREREKIGIYKWDTFFIASKDSDVSVKVHRFAPTTPDGKTRQIYEIALIDKQGKTILKLDNRDGNKEFLQQIKSIKKQYGFTECKKFADEKLARDYGTDMKSAKSEEKRWKMGADVR